MHKSQIFHSTSVQFSHNSLTIYFVMKGPIDYLHFFNDFLISSKLVFNNFGTKMTWIGVR